jgi:pescadillo protein
MKRKIRRAKGRKEYENIERLKQNAPKYTIDHIIKERYPTFNDALQELDDALSMIFLFVNMPKNIKIKKNRIVNCMKLCREFQLYVIKTHALRKIFVSIKGIYYQAEILDQTVTWLAPHQYNQQVIFKENIFIFSFKKLAKDVDYKVMTSFLELYENLMGFVLFRLYTQLGLRYPPDHSSLLVLKITINLIFQDQ